MQKKAGDGRRIIMNVINDIVGNIHEFGNKIVRIDIPQHEDIEVLLLSDVHIGEALHDRGALKKFINYILAKENRYVIVNGDLVNNAIRTSVSDIYTEKLSPDEQIDRAVEELTPIKDRILVIIDGNHEERTKKNDGISILKRVAREMGIGDKYREDGYLIYLGVGKNRGREDRRTVYSIYGLHGSGGGKKAGSTANAMESLMAVVDADIYVHGHTHLPMGFKKAFFRCDYRNNRVTEVEKMFVNASAMLKYGGYGMKLGFSPQSKSFPRIKLHGEHKEMEVTI